MNTQNTLEELGQRKGFKLVHLNIRSLAKKIDQVRLLMQGTKIDVFTISETWLKRHLETKLFDIDGFEIFRQDREIRAGRNKRGGGLITYVCSTLASSCEPLVDLDVSNEWMEAQWIYIHRPDCKNIIICNVYRPPSGDLKKAIVYLENCLKTINMEKVNIFVMGDFNVNYKNKRSPEYKKLHFFAQTNTLSQCINTTTRNTDKTKSLLDLVLTNSKYVEEAGTLDHYLSDHQPIYVVHKKSRDKKGTAKFSGRSYRNFNEEDFGKKLLSLNWDTYFEITEPEEAWNFILKRITKLLDDICPIRNFHIKNYRPDWMTKELIEQIKDRDYFYKKAKMGGGEDDWNIAKFLRNTTNSNIRQAKREYILDKLKMHENDAKKFWKVIKEVMPTAKSSKMNSPRSIFLMDGEAKVKREEVAHFINDYFINVGKLGIQIPSQTTNIDDSMSYSGEVEDTVSGEEINMLDLNEVSEKEVYNIVKEINVSKSSGIDNVSSYVLKVAFKALIPMITRMFNLSIQTAQYPDRWKKALVIPIPKTGNLSKVQNYRPISLLPLPGKIMEKLIHAQLTNHLETQDLLTEKQHGFRKEHSTIHSVAQVTNFISKKIDSRIPALAAFIDFKKAFDCVQHSVLLDKLESFKVGAEVLTWVRSYLEKRKQRVLANGTYSEYQTITQGVPQGSVLGPMLYIMYANDLAEVLKHCKIAMYADDTVIYTANDDFEVSISNLQKDLNSLAGWCNANGLFVNTQKTKIMTFGSVQLLKSLPPFGMKFNEVLLEKVASYKYLGITLDSQLNYNLHVNKTINSATSKLKQFQRMRNFLNTKAAIMVYKGMLLPILEYGDILLSATSNVNKKRLQILQNKGLRCALNKGIEMSITELHLEARLLRLKYRREQHLLNFMYDQAKIPTLMKTRPKNMIKTRSSNKKIMRLKKPRTEKFKKCLAYKGPKTWNSLPESMHYVQTKASYKLLVGQMVDKKSMQSAQKEAARVS